MPSNFARLVVWFLVAAALVVGGARATALRWWMVPEDDPQFAVSLAPSLRPGDWVILWRLTPPGYGDLVLCPDPQEPDEVVVGRIAAKSGDSLAIREDGQIKVNRLLLRSERSCKQPTIVVENPISGDEVELPCDVEAMGGVHHKRARVLPGGLSPKVAEIVVEDDHYFLLSDNRNYPFDSRTYGSVPIDSCNEAVVFRLVSREGYFDHEARLSFIQ